MLKCLYLFFNILDIIEKELKKNMYHNKLDRKNENSFEVHILVFFQNLFFFIIYGAKYLSIKNENVSKNI